MQLFNFLLLPFIVIVFSTHAAGTSSTTLGTFEGTSLCADFTRPFLNIPVEAQCDRIKWRLTLNIDRKTQSPTTYKLVSEFGYHVDNRTLLMKGRNSREGLWTVVKSSSKHRDSVAVIYTLEASDTQGSLMFQQIDPNLIHLLDQEQELMVGDAAQSFTLSRTDRISTATKSTIQGLLTPAKTRSAVVGVFTGRSPCREVAEQLKRQVGSDCNKLKWEVTLFQDPMTQTPTTFRLRGTLFRDFDREGKWTVQSRPGDQATVVYKLKTDRVNGSLLLLNADDNILFFMNDDGSLMVGNRDFSYTLNRVE